MTKEILHQYLLEGKTLSQILPFSDGQECMIFKAESFVSGNEILYVPDIDLNQIPIDLDLSEDNSMQDCGKGWAAMTAAEQIKLVLSYCYTGDEFITECDGNEELAKRLFYYVDWQHPCSALPEVDDGEDA